ncbi:MAG: glycosyltransferase family 2 protein [Bacteroidota bacterium]|nr:glycosyltransferase family 2 protein [Bacteroidota bacterium]
MSYTIKFVSIVVPSYNEEGNTKLLAEKIIQVMDSLNYAYEVIFVNDGSMDNTWDVIENMSARKPELKGIDLAGNYGQTIALRAGFEQAKGDVVIAMDGDMQHDPVYIPELLKNIEEGYEMVGGAKAKRPDGIFKSFIANIAHHIICRISGVQLSYFGATFKAYRSYLLKNANLLGDSHRFLGAMVARKGIRVKEIPIEIKTRHAGKSNYHLSKMFAVIIDLVFLKFFISYINKPFRLFGVVGGIIFLIGAIFNGYYLFGSIFLHFNLRVDYVAEFLFSIALILVGLILISFGLIAEIGIHNYYVQGKHSPFVIRKKTGINQQL